jgi:hypothetical protein
MTIDSASWTGMDPAPEAAPHVCGLFHSKDGMQDALSRLEGSLFQRADLSVRIPGEAEHGHYASEEDPVREDDTRSLRQLGVGLGAYAAAALAAGVTVATGGAALPAVAAAAAAGGAAAVAGEAVGQAAAPNAETEQQQAAESPDGVIVMVSANTEERSSRAEEILHEAGATRVWRQPVR